METEPHGLPVVQGHRPFTAELALGFDPRFYRDHLNQSPAALNVLDFRDDVHARLTLFKDTSHYAEAGLVILQCLHGDLSKWWDAPG